MTLQQDARHLDQDALLAALRAAQPAVMLVPPWLLQAVIAHDLRLMPTGLQVPDEQLHVVDSGTFVRFVEAAELPSPGPLPPGPDLYLLERPDAEWLATTPAADVLVRFWRMLVRATAEVRVRRALPASDGNAPCVRAAIAARVGRIGPGRFDEARHVLLRERRLTASSSDVDAYAKFAAAFADLHGFAPRVVPHVFPSVADPDAVAAVVAEDVGADLVTVTRPLGAPDLDVDAYQPMEPPYARRTWWAIFRQWMVPKRKRTPTAPLVRRPSKRARGQLIAAAERAEAVGNDVRAAILTARAHRSDGDDFRVAPGQAAHEIDRLANRLCVALRSDAAQGSDDASAPAWRDALRSLVGPASVGWWGPESRLLYDLQKVCVDHEREIYSVNIVEWVLELGRKPLYRPLPNQRLSLAARHLASAANRLPRCRLAAGQRARLDRLLHDARHSADLSLRDRLVPAVGVAFDTAGLHPRDVVQAVGREKLIQELLDDVLHDGYLTFAGVRDAISRNAIRCKDLDGPAEWLGYDQLMKLDRHLGDAMDGVYRRGEIYRYLFQKLSSWLFASSASRVLTKTVILPVAGSYIVLEAIQHTVGLLTAKLFGHHMHLLPVWSPPDPVHAPEAAAHFDSATLYTNPAMWVAWVATGLALFGLVNSPAVRKAAGRGLAMTGRAIGFLLFEVPDRLLRLKLVRAVLGSRPFRLALRYGVKPLLFVLLAWALLPDETDPAVRGLTFGLVFLLVNLVLNSPSGRAAEQAALHALRVGWVRFTSDVLAQAVRGVARFFERMVETVDRMLYAVDEWLRFRGGERRRSLAGKAVLSVFWFYIAYVARFALNLLVEPQINPIKHFPVVTVSHKLLIPMIEPMANAMVTVKIANGLAEGRAYAAAITTSTPGVFGFLAWELKENWKLYQANLPTTLRPVHFGSHGESVAQLLRPGFHSGTLPKAYARVRRAHRNYDAVQAAADPTEYPLAVRKHLTAVEHVADSMQDFVRRAFLPLVNRHPAFRETEIRLDGVEVGATRLAMLLACPAIGPELMRVEFNQRYGWIVGEVVTAGWSAELADHRAELLAYAVRGLFKMAAVDVVPADVDAAFAPRAVTWELRPKSLVVRPADAPDCEVEYPLYERTLRPRHRCGPVDEQWPTLKPEAVLFSERDVPWSEWLATWSDRNVLPPVMPGPAVTEPAHASP